MISKSNTEKYCAEDISLIENYKDAINDKFYKWHCHHRLEIQEDGQTYSVRQLKEKGLYYNRPASELIFLSPDEHFQLHMKYTEKYRNIVEKYKKVKEERRKSVVYDDDDFFGIFLSPKWREHQYLNQYENTIYAIHLIQQGKIKDVSDVYLVVVAVMLDIIPIDKYKDLFEKAKTRPIDKPFPEADVNEWICKINNVSKDLINDLEKDLILQIEEQKIKAAEETKHNEQSEFFPKISEINNIYK